MTGLVSLVGAGPGDPELLTLRAMRRLAEADLVLYDALVAGETLAFAPRARRFFVGKRTGRPGIGQAAINRLMILWARRGRRVVRLKCGDPFVFGRGGEEMQALVAAGVSVEVVPGVSSALAAPALSGIPLTHRGVASAFVVVSGHSPDAFGPIVDSLAPGTATLVVLMGLATRTALTARLLGRGWDGATPAALTLAASTPRGHTWTGTLLELPHARLPSANTEDPGTVVIGEAVALRTEIAAPDRLLPGIYLGEEQDPSREPNPAVRRDDDLSVWLPCARPADPLDDRPRHLCGDRRGRVVRQGVDPEQSLVEPREAVRVDHLERPLGQDALHHP